MLSLGKEDEKRTELEICERHWATCTDPCDPSKIKPIRPTEKHDPTNHCLLWKTVNPHCAANVAE